MSVVTDIILTTSSMRYGDTVTIDDVNGFFEGVALHHVDKPRGAPGKAIQADIFIGAFNYLDLDAFIDHLRALPWDDCDRQQVRLFVQEEHDEYGFHEVDIWPGRKRSEKSAP